MSTKKRAAVGSDVTTMPEPSASPRDDVTRSAERASNPSRPAALSLVDAEEADDKANPSIQLGEVIAGKYRIDEVIGRGGMGVVLRARHLVLEEPVVIKVLRPSLMNKDGMVARFEREARAAHRIKSDHVVRVMDIDKLDSGVPYIVMEWLEGTDLSAVLREQGKLPIEKAVSHILDACDVIAEAHKIGIIHRDLKPANLFLARRRDGNSIIKVLDFGISKIEGLTLSEEDSTKPGMMMGSPKFMSPEQMMSMRDVSVRADIWALGAILYNLLTGVPPFVAASLPQVCALVLNAEPESLRALVPEIDPKLEAVVLRCLKKKPADRFASVAELIEALEPFAPDAAPVSRQGTDLVTSSSPAEAPERLTPTPPPASPQHTSITSTLDTPAPPVIAKKRRSPARILGWLTLVLVLGGAGVVFAPRIKPFILHIAQQKGSTPPSATAPPADTAPIEPPTDTAATMAPIEPPAPSSTADINANATPSATTSAQAPGGRKPWVPSGKPWKPPTKGDPFGGTRN